MVVDILVNWITQFISSIGYFGVFFLMVLESAVMPVPSEVVMPFAGYLGFTKVFNLWYVVLAGTVGNLIGSLIAYYAGLYLGRGFILRYGKYILLKKEHLLLTEKWFKKYGDKIIFFSRMMPVVRTIISLPAGIGRMNLTKFIIYTFVGSVPWNFALTYMGYWLGKRWELILSYSRILDIIVGVGIVFLIVWYSWSHRKNRNKD